MTGIYVALNDLGHFSLLPVRWTPSFQRVDETIFWSVGAGIGCLAIVAAWVRVIEPQRPRLRFMSVVTGVFLAIQGLLVVVSVLSPLTWASLVAVVRSATLAAWASIVTAALEPASSFDLRAYVPVDTAAAQQ